VDDDDAGFFGFADGTGLELLAFPEDLAFPSAVRVDRGEHLHQRRLACAVFTTQANAFASAHFQVNPVERLDAAEFLDDASHVQEVFGHGFSF